MACLPKKVSDAWDNRKGPIIFSTVDADGKPNAIYANSVKKVSDDTIVVANNFFSKTLQNILAGSKGSILFLMDEETAYQIKGSIEYRQDGDLYEEMKTWNRVGFPGHGAAVLKIEEVYCGAERLV